MAQKAASNSLDAPNAINDPLKAENVKDSEEMAVNDLHQGAQPHTLYSLKAQHAARNSLNALNAVNGLLKRNVKYLSRKAINYPPPIRAFLPRHRMPSGPIMLPITPPML